MEQKTIEEIQEIYDLELEKVISRIKEKKAKVVLLQFPEGLKPYAQVICDDIENRAKCRCMIWMGSCYGACDIPNLDNLNADLIVQFGHNEWKF